VRVQYNFPLTLTLSRKGRGNSHSGASFNNKCFVGLELNKAMPGRCAQCGSRTYLGRTTIQTDLLEIRNIPCTICQECDHEQIGSQVQSRIDKLVERAAKGKLKDRVVTM